MKEKFKVFTSFALGAILSCALCVGIFGSTIIAEADEVSESPIVPLRYTMHINGVNVVMDNAFIKDGRTYVQLREIAEKTNMSVNWVDPAHHMVPIPGGSLPEGINVTNPSYKYVYDVTDFDNTSQTIKCVDVTGVYNKYYDDGKLSYGFSAEGLIIRTGPEEEIIPLDYNPNMGRLYLEINEFEEKVLPYFIEICMQ